MTALLIGFALVVLIFLLIPLIKLFIIALCVVLVLKFINCLFNC